MRNLDRITIRGYHLMVNITWHAVYEGVVLEKKSKMETPLGRTNVKASQTSGGSRGGAQGARASPLFWIKKEEMTEGKMADRASKSRPPPTPPLSSRSGSATANNKKMNNCSQEKQKQPSRNQHRVFIR